MEVINNDARKNFIINTAGNYFGLTFPTETMDFLRLNSNLNDFLEDIGCFILTAKCYKNSALQLNNKLPPGEGTETLLVFFKIRPEVVTDENIHKIVFVSSMLDSPVTALYYTIQRVFAPVLLKDEKWSQTVEPTLQTLVTDLEAGLRSVVLRAEPDASPPTAALSEVMTVDDEIQYWTSVAKLGKRKGDQLRGKAFLDALNPLGVALRHVETLTLADADELVEIAYNALDDTWKLDEYRYPQQRMQHLMEIIGKTLTRFIQNNLKGENIWERSFTEIEAVLSQSHSATNKFVQTCQRLTTLFWPNHSLHRWVGIPYCPVYITKFTHRLSEILKLRTVDRQLTRLLSTSEQEQLDTASNFKCFAGLNVVQYNPYTEPIWQAAVKQFELKVKPAEERVAAKLKQQLRTVNANTLQLLQEFKRYQELIQRPIVQNALLAERENLLGLLQDYVGSISIDDCDSSQKLFDMPPVVARLHWVRQLEAKVTDIEKTSESLLRDLGSFQTLVRGLDQAKKELKNFHSEQLDRWTRETGSSIANKTLGLKTDDPVVHFEQGKLMHVNYNPRLVGLVKEVRQILVMGYSIPMHIQEAAELAKRFIRQARSLQQVATFHNTIGDRMIASQRPMMLSAAVELARLVREQHSVTWSNTTAVDTYITKLQASVERLYKENNQLARYHVQITDKVALLMGTDLLRHQQQWKEGLREIRDIMTRVEEQFSNMKSWRAHWEHQLYKALEHQYQLGLESLNQNLPEIKVDLVYRQQKLQFSPPMEEIRMKYYGQLKRFLAIPLNFRGVSDTCIFPVIIDHNAHRFARLFSRAEVLFERLEKVCDEWRDWVALGATDMDSLARQYLTTAEDWDINFRASKTWGQEIAKLISTERKLDCFTIILTPVCSEIELHNRRYWDTLSSSLHGSILDDVATIEKFVTESKKALQVQPQCLEEIGEANMQYLKIMEKAKDMQNVIEEAQKKNKTLASWTKEKVDQVMFLVSTWDNFQTLLNNQQYLLSKQVESMKNNLTSRVETMATDLERFVLCWAQMKPKEESLETSDNLQSSLQIIRDKRKEWNSLMEAVNKLKEDHVHFSMTEPDFPQCTEVEEDLKQQEDMWALFDNFNNGLEQMAKEEWIVVRGKCLLNMNTFILDWTETLTKVPTTSLIVRLLHELQEYKDLGPVLKYVRGDMFSEKHWVELFSIIGSPYKPVESLVFGDFLKLRNQIIFNADALQDLNNRAAGEIVIRQALAELDIWEVEAKFSLTSHTDSKGLTLNLIQHFNEIMNKVGDNQCLLQSVKSSPNYDNFRDRASIWETRLSDLDNFLRSLNQIQRKWVYLEPIFGGGTLTMEKGRFDRVDRDLRLILNDLASGDWRVITLCRIPHLRNTLQVLLQQLAHCQKSLLDFLEMKRLRFPRFYFLSDEDLLEILGQANKQHVIQSHLKKLFSGIHSVVFKEDKITAMQSLQGETVVLRTPVLVTSDIEEWLCSLSEEMKATLKLLVVECLKNPDPIKFPSQVLCLAERVSFTSRCEKAIQTVGLRELHKALKEQLEMYTGYQLESSSGTDQDKDSLVLELKLKALLLDTIYHISVVCDLLDTNVSSVNDWNWQRRLRFYMREDNIVVARMVDAEFVYTYEYQGNAAKLVHTPLTDKCYLTLTQAMSMGLGGNPYGPAGTGKTESVKALGGLFGRQVLVFNCDEGIDVQSLTRILVGLVKCGAWGCFDEFNRLEEATLSAISMQIHPIQEALRKSAKMVKLLDQEVDVDSSTGIFVTLNPAGKGYAGRQKLPDNLKQLFRPVIMSKPDDTLIAEVILHCEGFKYAPVIGHKLVTLFDLSKKLLSKQQHYDWGLRALKTVVGGCGSALRHARAANISIHGEQGEMTLCVRALRLNTLSKLTFGDGRSFDALVQDIFPGIKFESSSHEKLADVLVQTYKELGLIYNERQGRKCIELYEQIQQRMGVVIVGPSGSGKSVVRRLLKNALLKLGINVKQHTINAKAMGHTQLLGNIDLDTRQWTDGVLSKTAQIVYTEPSDVESWIVFDGDVDPEWIESLNSVLDDNRLLTLPSGWRIQFGPNVHFLFETHELTLASPATISRMGMILLSEEDVDRKSVIEAWLLSQPEELAGILAQYIEDYFYQAVSWVLEKGELALQCSTAALLRSGLSHMSGVTSRANFTIALINGLGANLTPASKEAFCKQVIEWTGEFIPDTTQLQYCYYDSRRDCVDVHVTDSNVTSNNLVLTAQIKTASDVIVSWLESRQSFIVLGPSGCGKSMLLEHCFGQLRNVEVATVHCSAQISPHHILQKLSQLCMTVSSNTGRVFKPTSTERLILHMKNINLVKPDKWGTRMLTAWLQQVLTYGAFYDSNLEWVGLENVQLVFSLTSGEVLNPRFISHNNIYSMSSLGKSELKAIYSAVTHDLLPTSKQSSSLAAVMVNIYQEVKDSFSSVEHQQYLYTLCDLTKWCSGMLRYTLSDKQSLIEALLYEAMRQFGDKLVSQKDRVKLCNIINKTFDNEFNISSATDKLKDVYYVSETVTTSKSEAPPLLRLSGQDCTLLVEKSLTQLGLRDVVILPELVEMVAKIDRVLTSPGGSLLLAGKSGVGRKTAVRIVASRQSATIYSLNMTYAYNINNFKNDLKAAMQLAGVDGEQVYLVLEDHNIVHSEFLDIINSLLSCGEVPGLYHSEELEASASVLKDLAAQNNFEGNISQYFAKRVQTNLHVVLVLDCTHPKFATHCINNPALLKSCTTIWLDSWTNQSLFSIPKLLYSRDKKLETGDETLFEDNFMEKFATIHEHCGSFTEASPRRYFMFVSTFLHIFKEHKVSISDTQTKLQAGVSKLTEARNVVDTLKLEAAEQGKLLAEKQGKATSALEMITETMSNANIQRGDMDTLKLKTEQENEILVARKKEIEAELAEIEPLIKEACAAVGNIKSESLSEIRSLRAPPEVIRDILEGVLRLMGIQDTSWNSMKTFLAKRGVKEDIRCFEARNITRDNRESVEVLLTERRDSFVAKTAKRASLAAAPLAAWVTANVKYSRVLEKIRPLEREQANLLRNLRLAEDKIEELSSGLQNVDKTVAELKTRLNMFTKEAAEIEIHLNKAQETINAAESLVYKLDEEYSRWQQQLNELSKALTVLPQNSLLAAAFVTYLSSCPQDVRRLMATEWSKLVGLEDFSLMKFLGSERQQLLWQSQGLPSDQLSLENALIILTKSLRPLLLDPSSFATEWLKKHLSGQNVEVTSQSSPRFNTTLDLAIRFGKVLIVQDVDYVDPVLFPVLRGDINQQDVRNTFQLFMTTRNVQADIEPHIGAVISKINFTTTEAGLAQQLVQCALRQEKPELEVRRRDLLRQEEDLKMSLDQLQENVLQQLANAQGDILQNKELLESLNDTKLSSAAISESLTESKRLKADLMSECDMYQPLAEYASKLYFAVTNLTKINNMYQISIPAFLKLFQKTLASNSEVDMTTKKQKLLQVVYLHITRSVFKSDRLIFALHLVHNACLHLFQTNEWELLIGQAVGDVKVDSAQIKQVVPVWISSDRAYDVYLLQNTLPELFKKLILEKENLWLQFPQSPAPTSLTSFQHVLLVQALCPDLLHSALTNFALQSLGVAVLSPPPLRLSQLLNETSATEPILIITSPGSDPSQELRNLAQSNKSMYYEVALGEGQETTALQLLTEASSQGHWLCLKNLHLMTSWLSTLEKELQTLQTHSNFRLWLTTEPHHKFSSVLATCCLKVVYEAPQGVKRNLLRTYSSWENQREIPRALFVLAWFHAIVQERRTYIPQGWAKLYEFNDTDLSAALQVLQTILNKDGKDVRWDFVQGLCESAIYGGRVDNIYDLKVLSSYLHSYFKNTTFTDRHQLAPGVFLPPSTDAREHIKIIERLPENDSPSFFGLSANIDRSWQRNRSMQVIDNLKALSYNTEKSTKFDRLEWQAQMSPLLNLWKKLNQSATYIKMKVPTVNENAPPLMVFFSREFSFGVLLIQSIHQSLAAITRVIKGSVAPKENIFLLANSIMQLKTPDDWLKLWSGPTNPMHYVHSVLSRVEAMSRCKEQIKSPLDLADVFHAEIFFSAFKQQSSREKKVPIDDLVLSCNWGAGNTSNTIILEGLQLEGAMFDGKALVANTVDSPDVITAPLLTVSWIPKSSYTVSDSILALPLYLSAEREVIIAELKIPCKSIEHDKWIITGTAFYIRT